MAATPRAATEVVTCCPLTLVVTCCPLVRRELQDFRGPVISSRSSCHGRAHIFHGSCGSHGFWDLQEPTQAKHAAQTRGTAGLGPRIHQSQDDHYLAPRYKTSERGTTGFVQPARSSRPSTSRSLSWTSLECADRRRLRPAQSHTFPGRLQSCRACPSKTHRWSLGGPEGRGLAVMVAKAMAAVAWHCSASVSIGMPPRGLRHLAHRHGHPGTCRSPEHEASAVSHVSWTAAKLQHLARPGHTVGLLEGWKAEGLQCLWPRRWLQWRGTVP